MNKGLALSFLVASLLGPAASAAEGPDATFEIGSIVGLASDVRETGMTTDELVQLPSVGLLLRGGVAGEHFEAGLSLSGSVALFSPGSLAAGIYGGPSFALTPRLRLSLTADLGWQSHTGLGNEYLAPSVQSADVSLPYAGGTAALWWGRSPEPGRTSLSFGLLVQARFDLEHGTGQALVTPGCTNLLECVAGGESQPFTQTYDVGGHAIYVGFVLRLNAAPHAPRAATDDEDPRPPE